MGVVNIFLGGTGKYIAEELKGTAAFYNVTMPPTVAFDLDPSSSHSGTFTLGPDLLGVGANFERHASQTLAHEWSGLQPGLRLLPETDINGLPVRGPAMRPEASIKTRIAQDTLNSPPLRDGLWGMRGTGLLAYAALSDPQGGNPANFANIRGRFQNMLQQAYAANQPDPVRVNIVASTAGGTGAGLFLPFSLAVRELADSLSIPTVFSLFLVTASAFENENAGAARDKEMMLTKGRSGTFAILRELQLLHRVDPSATMPKRFLPLEDDEALPYRLGSQPFNQVYWIGRRPADVSAGKTTIYAETSRILALFSDLGFTNNANALVGPNALRQLPTVVSVEYPKLRLARKLTGELVVDAVGRLLGNENDAPHGERLGDYGTGPLATFFTNQNSGVFASPSPQGNHVSTVQHLDQLINPFTPDFNAASLPHGNGENRPAIYSAAMPDWIAHCNQLETEAKQAQAAKFAQIDQDVPIAISMEEHDCSAWISQKVFAALLTRGAPPADGAPPPPILTVGTAKATVNVLNDDRKAITEFFSREALARLNNAPRKFQAPDQVQRLIDEQYKRLRDPSPRKGRSLTTGQRVLLIFIFFAFAYVGWTIGGVLGAGPFFQVLLGIATGFVVDITLRAWLVSRPARTAQLRREAEAALMALYRDLMYAYAAQQVFASVRNDFAPKCAETIKTAEDQLDALKAVYEKLRQKANEKIEQTRVPPPHVVHEVGLSFQLGQTHYLQLRNQLLPRIDVMPMGTRLQDLQILIHPLGPGAPVSRNVQPMAQAIEKERAGTMVGPADPGARALDDIDRAIEDSVILTLGGLLPQTFQQAFTAENPGPTQNAVMSAMLAKLIHFDAANDYPLTTGIDRRVPDHRVAYSAATVRRLVVPPDGTGLLVQNALAPTNPHLRANAKQELESYLNNLPQPIPLTTVGAAIVLFSSFVPNQTASWAPDVPSATNDITEAQTDYFALAPNARDPNEEHIFSQLRHNFHILPELAAAASIELANPAVHPLNAAVVARLVGSDPKADGPAILELFYLLRHRGFLRTEQMGSGPNRQVLYVLYSSPTAHGGNGAQPGAGLGIELLRHPVAVGPVTSDPFGSGRVFVNWFDAFMDFLLHDPTPFEVNPMTGDYVDTRQRFTRLPGNTSPSFAEWAQAPDEHIFALQHAAVREWHNVTNVTSRTILDEEQQLITLVNNDAAVMTNALGNDWKRAVISIITAGSDKRLRSIGTDPKAARQEAKVRATRAATAAPAGDYGGYSA